MAEFRTYASGSGGNLYTLSDGKTTLLLEAGLPLRRIREALGFGVSRVAGVCISHEHGDHAKGVRDLMKAGLDCYMSAGSAEALGLDGHRLHIVRARVAFAIGTWTVLPFEAVHDAAEPLNFLFASGPERVLFATDTAYVKYRFPGLSRMAIEANYDLPVLKANVAAGIVDREVKRRVVRSHMSIDTLCDFLRANDLRQLREVVLLHLSDDSGDAEGFARRVRELVGRPVRVAEATTLGRVMP